MVLGIAATFGAVFELEQAFEPFLRVFEGHGLRPDGVGERKTGRGIALRDRGGFEPSLLPVESRLLLASQEAVQIGSVEC